MVWSSSVAMKPGKIGGVSVARAQSIERSTLRPSLSSCCLINQKFIKLISTFDRSNQPTRSCATTCPGFTGGTTISRRNFLALQCASTATSNPCDADYGNIHPCLLLFNVGTTLKKRFLNPFSQVHERF